MIDESLITWMPIYFGYTGLLYYKKGSYHFLFFSGILSFVCGALSRGSRFMKTKKMVEVFGLATAPYFFARWSYQSDLF